MSSGLIRYLTGSLDMGYISPVDEGIAASGLLILTAGFIGSDNIWKPSIITGMTWWNIFSAIFVGSASLIVASKLDNKFLCVCSTEKCQTRS